MNFANGGMGGPLGASCIAVRISFIGINKPSMMFWSTAISVLKPANPIKIQAIAVTKLDRGWVVCSVESTVCIWLGVRSNVRIQPTTTATPL